jgi:hypothetical protein
MTTFTREGGIITIDCRQSEEMEYDRPPEERGRVYFVNDDHRYGMQTRVWQFWCPDCFKLWIASCGNRHDSEVPCVHCYDFKDRRKKHEESGWILTCYNCARNDRPSTDSTDNATTAEAGPRKPRGRPKGTAKKTTAPKISYKVKF